MSAESPATLELWQFRLSMYPEKARWALDHKQLPHVRHSLLPGPHIAMLLPRFRQKAMPILKHGETVVKGSANIVDYLEQQFPEHPLYPSDTSARTRALELQTWFDDAGVHLRRAFFRDALEDAGYMADRFSTGQPEPVRTVYRAAFPVTRQIMKLDMLITQRGADEGLRRTQEALDIVMKNRGSQDYLVDGRFTVADLCAATVLHPVVLPDEFPVPFPHPRPPGVERWLARWAAHPATEWVREIYRRHRGASHATQDLNL